MPCKADFAKAVHGFPEVDVCVHTDLLSHATIDTATAVLINNNTEFGRARRLPNPALGAVWHENKKLLAQLLFIWSKCLPSLRTLSYCLQIQKFEGFSPKYFVSSVSLQSLDLVL